MAERHPFNLPGDKPHYPPDRLYRAEHLLVELDVDPAAHRIPIYAVPGVLDQAQREEFQRLQKEATLLFESGDHDSGMDVIFKSQTIGTYQPWMALSHASGFELRDIVKQVGQDDENFVSISESVLQYLFAGPPQPLTDP